MSSCRCRRPRRGTLTLAGSFVSDRDPSDLEGSAMTSARAVLSSEADDPEGARRRSLLIAGGVIGVALGGFFDGILLHQILQWHHFLSLVPGEALRDIRAQILADGMFHVAVYAIAALGLWLLWRARGGIGSASGRHLLGAVLLGFGAWQVV